MDEKNKTTNATEPEKKELTLDEMDNVSGAGNPFADVPRVKNNDYDDDIKSRI